MNIPALLRYLPLAFCLTSITTSQLSADDPFLGDWRGDGIVAQVIPLGGQDYRIILLPEFDTRCQPLADIEAERAGQKLAFESGQWSGWLEKDVCELRSNRDGASKVQRLSPVRRPSPTLGAKPPEGAIVLFDGSGFEQWQVRGADPQTPIAWKIEDRAMVVAPSGRQAQPKQSLVTRQAFSDIRMHIEFWLPLMADQRGQARANGGVVFEDYNWCELQVLDSYGLEGKDNECGGIYKIAAPAVNMCRPPLMWQTYDIQYHAPRYDARGERTQPGRITVRHNGKLIHDDVQLPDSPTAAKRRKGRPGSVTVGRILLHYHHDPVKYRNIWVVPIQQ